MSSPTPAYRLCDFPGCPKPFKARGLCAGHHKQRELGKTLTPLRVTKPSKTGCLFPGCPKPHWGHGLCRPHNKRPYAESVPLDAPFKIQQQMEGRWYVVGHGGDAKEAHHNLNVFRLRYPANAYRLIVGSRPSE